MKLKLKREWYCLNCKKVVDSSASMITAIPYCKECGSPSIMDLEQTNPENLEKLARKFKEQTDKM